MVQGIAEKKGLTKSSKKHKYMFEGFVSIQLRCLFSSLQVREKCKLIIIRGIYLKCE